MDWGVFHETEFASPLGRARAGNRQPSPNYSTAFSIFQQAKIQWRADGLKHGLFLSIWPAKLTFIWVSFAGIS